MVKFSDVYLPLFDLLDCWDVINGKDFNKKSEEDQKYWLDLSKVDTVLISGGRDSGKTFALSCWNVVAAAQYNHRILYTRQTMSSTDNSITEALEKRMELLNREHHFKVANKIYETESGGKISITGQKTSVGTQTAKTKSLEGFSVFLTEEAEELDSFDKWKDTKRSMRATDVQCLSMLVFNPPTREHFIFKEFYESNGLNDGYNGVIGNTLYVHSTFKDNIKHIAPHNLAEYLDLESAYNEYLITKDKKLHKKYLEYKNVVLGGFRNIEEGIIIEDWEMGGFNEHLNHIYGLDFGSTDPNALVKVAVDHDKKLIYVHELFFGKAHLSELATTCDNYCKNGLIIGDSASKGLIEELAYGMRTKEGDWINGLNIEGVIKHKYGKLGFVEWGLTTMQGYNFIVTPTSLNIIKAFNNYAWHDKKSNTPAHPYSDIVDAIRYAFCEIMDTIRN